MLHPYVSWLCATGISFLFPGRLLAQSVTPSGILRKTLLQQELSAVNVENVRIDELTLGPGQGAPDHHHPCEVYGYVVEGQICYQVYGQPPVILNAGDSFREAAGQRVVVFKNALADKPSKFVAIYLAKKDQPLIVLTDPGKKP